MATTVSVSEFRRNLSDWLERAREGERIVVRDEREREDVAELRPAEEKNWDEIMKAVEELRGSWSEEDYRAWKKRKTRMTRNWKREMKRLWGG